MANDTYIYDHAMFAGVTHVDPDLSQSRFVVYDGNVTLTDRCDDDPACHLTLHDNEENKTLLDHILASSDILCYFVDISFYLIVRKYNFGFLTLASMTLRYNFGRIYEWIVVKRSPQPCRRRRTSRRRMYRAERRDVTVHYYPP